MLFASIVACAPVQRQDVLRGVRPVSPTSSALSTTDDIEYQGAVSAITDRDYGRALDYLQAARIVHANDVRVLNAFGVVYDKLGRFDLSARYYAQALAADPHSAIVLQNLDYSHVLEGMAQGTRTDAMIAITSPPTPVGMANPTPIRASVAPSAELALDPQKLPDRAPLKVIAAPSNRAELTAAAIPYPDLAPVMDFVELIPEPQMLPPRAAVSVMAATLVPASLTAADFETPDLSSTSSPEKPPEPEMAARRVLARVAAASPVTLMPGDDSIQELASTKFAIYGPEEPKGHSVSAALVAPPDLVNPAHFSMLWPALGTPQGFGQTKSIHLAKALMDKSRSDYGSPQRPFKAGRHLSVINATGQSGISELVRRQLLHLGWTAPQWAAGETTNQRTTTIRYARPDGYTARALARTIPFRVQLLMCVDPCNGIELILGSDYLEWKPKSNLARRWKSRVQILVSSAQRSEHER